MTSAPQPTAVLGTLADLRAYTPTAGVVIYLLGVTTSDGRRMFFQWAPASAAAEDLAGMTVVASSVSTTGRWLRVITPCRQQRQRVQTPAIGAGLSVDILVTWASPFPDTNYTLAVALEGAALLGLTPVVKSRSPTGCVVTIKNALIVNLALNAGLLHLTATADQG